MKTFDFWYIGVHGHANVQCCPGSHGLKNVQAYCSNSVWGHIHGLILIHQGQLIHFGKSCFITQWPTLMMDCYKGFHVQMQIWGVGVRSYGMGLLAYSEPQSRKKEFSIDDYLVMATDAEVNTFNTLGVVEYLHFIKEVKDAQKIRRSVMNCFEKAILSVLTKEERRISLINLVELIRGSVPNGDMTVWVQDPSSIIQILGISFICGLLRTKAFEGERLSRGGGGEWTRKELLDLFFECFLGQHCSGVATRITNCLGSLLFTVGIKHRHLFFILVISGSLIIVLSFKVKCLLRGSIVTGQNK
ncbi:putative NADH:ubiquinone reductase (non-electrogenic) [Helianthus annuus]|nr:putative NADH:ubiquinone reductase (non-electrogenic) [Helianthus annuus]KAJ0731963.1 putative NADH:ubiquinone reductase (non-electrogenic) [Helianthus annuus]KAJ0905566.1 putative NADH:ubiquinone reductase (non-electrogenic) [Helianthus annuus]